jgi:hypothetical protein
MNRSFGGKYRLIIRVIRIGELGTMLQVPSSLNFVTLMMEVIHFSELSVLQEPHVVISQKIAFFKVTAVKTSNLT